jgi:hypothetical protein
LGTQDTGLRQITIGHTRIKNQDRDKQTKQRKIDTKTDPPPNQNKKTGAKPGTREVLALKRNKILDIIKKPEINVGT